MNGEATRAEARDFLERQIEEWKHGWTNMIGPDKGKITQPHALRAIACLQWALKNLPRLARRKKEPNSDSDRLDWLDHHTAFVADHEYCIGPYKIGELRKMADAGIRADKRKLGKKRKLAK